jgi:hypothetical protein
VSAAAGLRGAALALRFLLELGVYGSVLAWGLRPGSGWEIRLLAGVSGALLLAVAWAVLASPRALRPLHGLPLVAFEVAWFGAGVLALAAAAGPLPAVVFAVLYAADVAVLRPFGR